MTDANQLTLEEVAADTPVLANLLSLYLHDLSVAFPSIELGDDGRFAYANLPLYASDPERRLAFLAKDRGRPVGFALVTRGSPASNDPNVWDVAEFFVVRGSRRAGVGRALAVLLWNRLPGMWVVRASEGNPGALPFWAEVVAQYTGGHAVESHYQGNPHRVRVFTFESPRSDDLKTARCSSSGSTTSS